MSPIPSSISSCFFPPGKLCHSVWQLGSTSERSDGTEGRNMCWGIYSPYSLVLPAVPGTILPICLSSSPALLKYIPAVISRPRYGDSWWCFSVLCMLPQPVCVCVVCCYVHSCVCLWRSKVDMGVCLYYSPPYLWERSHSLNVELRLDLLACKSPRFTCLCLPSIGVHACNHAQLVHGYRDPNSCSQAGRVGTLSAEPSCCLFVPLFLVSFSWKSAHVNTLSTFLLLPGHRLWDSILKSQPGLHIEKCHSLNI